MGGKRLREDEEHMKMRGGEIKDQVNVRINIRRIQKEEAQNRRKVSMYRRRSEVDGWWV